MRGLLFTLLLLTSTCICAQKKVWIDDNGNHVADSARAKRYALVFKKKDNLIKVEEYEKNGTLRDIRHYSRYNGNSRLRKMEGEHRHLYANGTDSLTETYRDGHITGQQMVYYPDGKMRIAAFFRNSMLAGKFMQFYPSGALKREEEYVDNQCTGGKLFTAGGSELPHQPYLVMPEFQGGMMQLVQLMSNIIEYPSIALKNNTEGTVIIRFFVEPDGTMTNPVVIQSVSKEIDAEAVRAFSAVALAYKWKPGYIDGTPVRMAFTSPLSFKIP